MRQVDRDNVGGFLQPVIAVEPGIEFVEQIRLLAQEVAHFGALGGQALFLQLRIAAAAQIFLGVIVEFAQQLPLPAVPDARPDRADIDNR